MKKILSFVAVSIVVLASSSAMAEGTKIEKSTVINASKNVKTNTQAIGEDSTASTGSVNIKGGAKVEKSTIINASDNEKTNTQAIGKGSDASTGSINIK